MAHLSSATDPDYFEPELYNAAELDFFLKHLGQSPEVAAYTGLPAGVTRAAVDDVIGRVYRFQELKKAHGDAVQWPGVDAVKSSIVEDMNWRKQCASVVAKGGPKHPSIFHWNTSGEGIRGATGSDGGTVRTRILPGGARKRLGIRLTSEDPNINLDTAYVADFAQVADGPDRLIHDETKRRYECPICAYTTTYKADNRRSANMARANMGHHLKSPKNDERTRHQRLWNSEYSSTRTIAVTELASD